MTDFTTRWAPEQRRAILASVLDDGLKLPKAIKLASRGELGNLEPFDIPYSTAHGIVTAERKRRRGRRTQQETIDDLYDLMLGRAAGELTRLTKKPKLSGTEITELRGWLKLSREVDRRPKPARNGQREPDDTPESTRERSFIDQLAEQAEAQATETQEEPTQTPTSPAEGEDRSHETPGENPLAWRAGEPSTPNTSHTLTDSQKRAAEAILGGDSGLTVPAS